MMQLLAQLDYWHWLIAAAVLVLLEVFSPGIFFLWMGIAAALVGGLLWLWPEMSWQLQLLLFGLLSIASVVSARVILARRPIETDEPTLNRRGEQYVGRVLVLDRAIENGVGRVRVDDTQWRVQGEDCAADTRVRVIGVDGTVLLVEPE